MARNSNLLEAIYREVESRRLAPVPASGARESVVVRPGQASSGPIGFERLRVTPLNRRSPLIRSEPNRMSNAPLPDSLGRFFLVPKPGDPPLAFGRIGLNLAMPSAIPPLDCCGAERAAAGFLYTKCGPYLMITNYG